MSDIRTAIDACNHNFMTNFGQQDAAGLAGLYTSNGCIMPSNSDIVSGAGNIQGFWQGVFDMGVKAAVLDTVDLEEHGNTAIETGRYTMKADGGAVADHGKYIIIWKKESGTWKLHKDIFNTSQPPA
jgi:ketosteroid isomerase-like protein